MTAVQVCMCVLLVAGAFALVCLGIVFIKMLSTLEQVNASLIEVQKSLDKADKTIDDVNYKLDLLNEPFEKVNGMFKKNKSGIATKTVSLVSAYRAGKNKK